MKLTRGRSALLFVSALCSATAVTSFASADKLLGVSMKQRAALRHHPLPIEGRIHQSVAKHLRGGAHDEAVVEELKDFSAIAANMFGNLRIPAALFAGAAAGAAFAMPLSNGEGVKLGMVKRLYALLMIGSLSSEVIAVTVATVTMEAMSLSKPVKFASVAEYLNQNYEFEWVTARFHFLSGLLLFVIGSGLRAWVTINCPVVAKAALALIVSGTLLTLAFIDTVERTQLQSKYGMLALPLRFIKLISQRITKPDGFLFGATTVSALATAIYLVLNFVHVIKFLAKTGAA
jgi:hypothetical protein